MRKFWHQSQASAFFRSEVTSVSAGHHFSRENPKNQPTQEFEDYLLQHLTTLKIIIGQSVFVYLTLSLSLYFTLYLCFCLFVFAFCSLSTSGHWAGGCQQFSLRLINLNDDDDDILFKLQKKLSLVLDELERFLKKGKSSEFNPRHDGTNSRMLIPL